MTVLTGFFQTLVLLGAIQGLILACVLFFAKAKGQANRILAGLIFLLALASLNLWMTDQPWIGNSIFWILFINLVPMIIVMPVGPLIYFYVRSVSNSSFRVTKKYRFHFYTLFIDLVPHIIALIYFTGLLCHWFRKNDKPWGQFIDSYNVYADIPRWFSISIYLAAAYRYLKHMDCSRKRNEHSSIKWLNQLIIVFAGFQFIWLIFLVPYVIPAYTDKVLDSLGWFPLYIPITILIYWLGLKGYRQLLGSSAKSKHGINLVISEDTIRQTILALENAMNYEHYYLDPDLDLNLLATHVGIAPKIISTVLNQHLQTSFGAYVNSYRVEAVKKRLLNLSDKHLSIIGLAQECGFNSQPTFQRSFKTFVGLTPKEFIEKNRDTPT